MAADFSNSNANIREAFERDDYNTIILLINNSKDVDGFHDYFNDGFAYYNLYIAARNANIELVKYLVSKGAMINQVSGHLEWTALHVAAFCGYFDIVTFLVDSGVDYGIKDKDGHTAVDLAKGGHTAVDLAKGRNEIVKYIESYSQMECLVKGVHCDG
jgi:ankyrin repeat protein